MKSYDPKIEKPKKDPKTPIFLVICTWILFVCLVVLDVISITSGIRSISFADIFCDAGVLAVAVYFTVKYTKDKTRKI